MLPVSRYLANIFVIVSNDLQEEKEKDKREPHPEVGGQALLFQFPHRQVVMALICEEILWNFTPKIWWFPRSIVYTMIIWKRSKVLVVPPQKTPAKLYFQMYLLIKKATIITSRKAIQLDGSYLKTKFCFKFFLDKIRSYKPESLHLAQLSHIEKSLHRGYSCWTCPNWKWTPVLLCPDHQAISCPSLPHLQKGGRWGNSNFPSVTFKT